MIIYKHDEKGKANFSGYQRDYIPVPDGCLSIPGDWIPGDINQYHTQDYRDFLAQETINEEARKFLAENDWKITRHIRHEKLVERGKLTQTALTEQEYEDLLIECQRQADLVIK